MKSLLIGLCALFSLTALAALDDFQGQFQLVATNSTNCPKTIESRVVEGNILSLRNTNAPFYEVFSFANIDEGSTCYDTASQRVCDKTALRENFLVFRRKQCSKLAPACLIIMPNEEASLESNGEQMTFLHKSMNQSVKCTYQKL